MRRLFTRFSDLRRPSESRNGSATSRPDAPRRRRPRRGARPGAESLDSRLLLTATVPSLSDRVAQVVQPYLAQGSFPGISVAVVVDGKVALAQGYGTADAATGAPVQANTRFDIGSLTKTFTAMAVLMLHQEARGTSDPLDLNAPIGQYLHNTPTFKLPHRWANITTKQLLAMTSGIMNVENSLPWPMQLKASARVRLRFTPGTESAYSNPNYYLLGELIEQRSGESYAAFIQDHILNPLGMTQTQELGHSPTVPDQAVGYKGSRHGRWVKAQMRNGEAMYASAGIVSNAQDMATYMAALLNGQFLSRSSYRLMWTPSAVPQLGADQSVPSGRGLGWDGVTLSGGKPTLVTKSGDVPGFTSQLYLDPATHSGVFVAINTGSSHGPDPSGTIALQLAQWIDQSAKPA